MSSEKSQTSDLSCKIKSYTTNQFVTRLQEIFDPFPKSIHVFFNIDSLKKSTIDVCYIKPVLFVLEIGKIKKFISAKELNEKLGHEKVYLNLRKGIENKLNQLKYQYYSLNIVVEKQKHEEFDYYPTSVSYLNDKTLIEKKRFAMKRMSYEKL
jgi:hypothetical protein